MTKQEEIREGLAELECIPCKYRQERGHPFHCAETGGTVGRCSWYYKLTDQILSYLHSKGIVIKVDRELPENPYSDDVEEYGYKNGYALAQLDMSGYVAVEPLIKELKSSND